MNKPPQVECLYSIFPKEICFIICKYAAPNIKKKNIKYQLYRRLYCEQLLIAHKDEQFVTPRGECLIEYPPQFGQHVTETSPNIQWSRARSIYIKSKHKGKQELASSYETHPSVYNFNVIPESLFCEWEENIPNIPSLNNNNKNMVYINKKYIHWIISIYAPMISPPTSNSWGGYESYDYNSLGATPWHYGIQKSLILNQLDATYANADHKTKIRALLSI